MAVGLWTACCVTARYSENGEAYYLYDDKDSTTKYCSNCERKNPEMVTVPSFNPPLEVELVLRRWKDGDAAIDDVFNGIEKFATQDFFAFIHKIRPPEALPNNNGSGLAETPDAQPEHKGDI